MSPAKRSRKQRAGGGGERRLALLLLLVAGALFTFTGVVEGPGVARQVWSMVGVKKVESHAGVVCAAAAESGLDPSLLAGIMYVESRGNPAAVSPKGALGLFQLMPAAASDSAKRLRLKEPTREQLLTDTLLNARLAASHLAWLYRHEGPDMERVLVAYNAGRGTLARWLKESGGWSNWRETHHRKNDSPTLTYAQEVLDFADRFRRRGVIVEGASLAASEGGF
ncbi:MAG: lytic transglycosylase domain-containing protein [Planctomycetes bacterium]|nr:lytic transglycosylase domain-containing protein [Planctomycetota bacterium]